MINLLVDTMRSSSQDGMLGEYIDGLRLVASKAISEVGVVGLSPAGIGGGLSATETSVSRNLTIALASHSRLIPTSSSRVWS